MRLAADTHTLALRETFRIARGAADEETVVAVTLEHDGVTAHGEGAPVDREAIQALADLVGIELEFGAGYRFGLIDAIFQPVERCAFCSVARRVVCLRRFVERNAAPMTRDEHVAL